MNISCASGWRPGSKKLADYVAEAFVDKELSEDVFKGNMVIL